MFCTRACPAAMTTADRHRLRPRMGRSRALRRPLADVPMVRTRRQRLRSHPHQRIPNSSRSRECSVVILAGAPGQGIRALRRPAPRLRPGYRRHSSPAGHRRDPAHHRKMFEPPIPRGVAASVAEEIMLYVGAPRTPGRTASTPSSPSARVHSRQTSLVHHDRDLHRAGRFEPGEHPRPLPDPAVRPAFRVRRAGRSR